MNGKILLQPMGGLANRMRIISVLFELCKNVGAEFEVLWANNSDLGATWNQLFEQPSFEIKNIFGNYIHASRSKRWYRRFPHQLWMCIHNYTWLAHNDVCTLTAEDTIENSAKIRNDWTRRLSKGERLFICSGDNIGRVNDLSMFSPNKEVSEKVDKFWSECSYKWKTIYGIHIRRADNVWSIEDSPIYLFENKISDLLIRQPDAVFFLASDDLYTISCLKNKYGDRIITRNHEMSRSTIGGMQDALIDMLLLGKTKKIFGSYFSSFSEMASWYGGVELEILKK